MNRNLNRANHVSFAGVGRIRNSDIGDKILNMETLSKQAEGFKGSRLRFGQTNLTVRKLPFDRPD